MHRTSTGLIQPAILALAIGATLPMPASAQLDPPLEQYAKWKSVNDAITALWNARLTYNKRWAWGTLNENLDPTISSSIDKGSGLKGHMLPANSIYLIPKVSIRSTSLPRGVHHLSAALLTYDTTQVVVGHFYPAYTDHSENDRLFNTPASYNVTYTDFFGAGTRSRHDNVNGYLPAVAVPTCPEAVAAAVNRAWVLGKQAALNALDSQPGITNAQRWQCYAQRAAPPGVNLINAASGYMEFDHPDASGAGYDREFSDSNNGRIVYDYVNGKVYYTPTHYRPSYYQGRNLTVSPTNFCPDGQVCANPFFEIVE